MSAAEDLLHDLAEHGVTVWQEAGQLRYRAPAGAVTPATMAAMWRHKLELLALLAANDCGGQDSKVLARVESVRTGPLVLTFELDGGQATCIDPVSATMADAVADIRRQFPDRVGRIWNHSKEVSS